MALLAAFVSLVAAFVSLVAALASLVAAAAALAAASADVPTHHVGLLAASVGSLFRLEACCDV